VPQPSSASSRESVEQTLASSEQDSVVSPKSKSTHDEGQSLPATSPGSPNTPTSAKSGRTTSPQQMSLLEASPARTSQWRESVVAWLASGPDCSTSSAVSLTNSLPSGFASRTSLAFCPPTPHLPTGGGTLALYYWSLRAIRRIYRRKGGAIQESVQARSGRWPGACLTLDTSESPNGAVGCFLSEVQESQVASRFFLSQKAARGILRRAKRRGKKLPPRLEAALTQVAGETKPTSATRTSGAISPKRTPQEPCAAGPAIPTNSLPIPSGLQADVGLPMEPTTSLLAHCSEVEQELGALLGCQAKGRCSSQAHSGVTRAEGGDRMVTSTPAGPLSLEPSPQSGQRGAEGQAETNAKTLFVRRLTPTECERLQAFPDGWTCKCGKHHGKSVPVPTTHDIQPLEMP
jgi:hypothetical protein